MPLKIGWSISVHVPSGPSLSVSRVLDANAYDHIRVDLKKNTQKSLEVQPGGANQVKLLAIIANRYEDLSFKVHGVANATEVTVDQPPGLRRRRCGRPARCLAPKADFQEYVADGRRHDRDPRRAQRQLGK